MAFTEEHCLVRAVGSFGPNETDEREIWTCGWRVDIGTDTSSEDKKVAFLATIQDAVRNFHAAPPVAAHQYSYLQKLTAAYIAPDGRYLGREAQTTTEYIYASPAAGASTIPASWDTARTYTLRTLLPRGRGSVGRFYWPCGAAVLSTGLWPDPDIPNAATAAKGLLDAMNSAAATVWTGSTGVRVYSYIGNNSNKVVRVEVGHAPDTQRRRTRSLLETYAGADLAGVGALLREHGQRVYGSED